MTAGSQTMGLAGAGRQPVLLVEDNDELRRSTTRLLSPWFDIEPVATLRAALAAMSRRTPAAIVADVMLPDGDGYELLSAVRRARWLSRPPVLLLSALAQPAEQVRGLEAGADDYVIKPFSVRELAARIAAAIGRMAERNASLDQQREDLVMELHDGVCSTLTHAALLLTTPTPGRTPDSRDDDIAEAVRRGLAEARSLLEVLVAADQSWSDLAGALARQLAEGAAPAGLDLEFHSETDPNPPDVCPAAVHALRRIAGEALTNAVKHSAARRLKVTLQWRDRVLRFCATDDGPVDGAPLFEGRGLSIVRRRAARLGGGASFGRAPEGGFCFEAWLRGDR